MGEQQLLFPGFRAVDREWLDCFIGWQRAVQDQAAFGGDVPGVQLEGGLQAIDPLLGGIHRGAHPYPVGCVVLVRLEQTCQYFAGPTLISRSQGFYCFLENSIAVSHKSILPDTGTAHSWNSSTWYVSTSKCLRRHVSRPAPSL